mmetsp:Transcript_4131/g.7361  ORF Transcript_4131/g.7361 Transcript_4131/m.7361 type:complete len:84 (-) Transcript_4131:3293-3544(-)
MSYVQHCVHHSALLECWKDIHHSHAERIVKLFSLMAPHSSAFKMPPSVVLLVVDGSCVGKLLLAAVVVSIMVSSSRSFLQKQD